MRESIRFLAGALLAGLLLWWVVRGVEPSALLASLGKASLLGLLAAALLNLGHNVFRVWRWGALLKPVRNGVRFQPMFTAVILGYATTWVLPGRLGELVRPAFLSAREGVPLGPCLGSVLADRMLDGLAIVCLFAVGSWWSPLEGPAGPHRAMLRAASLGMLALALGCLAGLALLSRARGAVEIWAEARRGWPRWLGRTGVAFAEGGRALRDPRLLGRVAVHSIAAWVAIAAATWIGVRAAGAALPFSAVLVILPMLALGVAVPTPGGAGSYHGALKIGLVGFGVDETTAVGAAILMHLLVVVPPVLLALALAWREGVAWRDVLAMGRALRRFARGEPGAGARERAVEGRP